MLTLIDNLKVKVWKDRRWLVVESAKLDEALRFINSPAFNSYEGVVISRDLGYQADNLGFLKKAKGLRSVSIADDIRDVSDIHALDDLRVLALASVTQPIDLRAFPQLRELSFEWERSVTNINSCVRLEKIVVENFKPTTGFHALAPLIRLKELHIVKSPLASLDGISSLHGLHILDIYQMPKLERVSGLTCPLLDTLIFSGCRKIKDHSSVAVAKSLRILKFNDCGSIPSIAFIAGLPKLETFTFVNTHIQDGNMQPTLRLKYVGFTDEKHYSHSCEDIQRSIRAGSITSSEESGNTL